MLKKSWFLTILLAFSSSLAAGEMLVADHPIPNRYIVALNEEAMQALSPADAGAARSLIGRFLTPLVGDQSVTRALVTNVAHALSGMYGGSVDQLYPVSLPGFSTAMSAQQAAELARDWRVKFVEPDTMVSIQRGAVQTNASWGLDRIDQHDQPLDQRYRFDVSGNNVHAYIIDTGIRASHQEFAGRVGEGYDGLADGRLTTDCNGHGTHVAGIVAGTVYGVAKQALLHPVRVLGCSGAGPVSDVIAGVEWVTANRRLPAVANISLGGSASPAMDNAVRAGIASGVFFAVAAGNASGDACLGSPNRVPEVMTVASTTATDVRSSFSNSGRCIDLFAPGSDIVSAWFSSDIATHSLSGTSQASPHVAGAAALYLTGHPQATPLEVTQALIGASTSNRVVNPGPNTPNRLLYSLTDVGVASDAPPVSHFTMNCLALSCTFDATNSFDDLGITEFIWDFGDGISGTGQTVSHEYAQPGSYEVNLDVADTSGQRNRSLRPVFLTSSGLNPCANCARFTGVMRGNGDIAFTQQFTVAQARVQSGYLKGPPDTDFDLFLDQFTESLLVSGWTKVVESAGPGSSESIEYPITPGIYRWRIQSTAGSGAYDFFGEGY